MKYLSFKLFNFVLIMILSIILIGNFIIFSAADDQVLNIYPNHGPPGTVITVNVDIKEDLSMEYWNDYYGLEFKVVWNIRPADIINPNLWGYKNPIGTANIDYNGELYGSATIPSGDEPGIYTIYAAYEKQSGDPYHYYWSNTFTLEGDSGSNDRDGDGWPDSIDMFPDDPYEWNDYDYDGIGDNSDPDPYGDGENIDNNDNINNNTPGFSILIIIVSIIILHVVKKNKY